MRRSSSSSSRDSFVIRVPSAASTGTPTQRGRPADAGQRPGPEVDRVRPRLGSARRKIASELLVQAAQQVSVISQASPLGYYDLREKVRIHGLDEKVRILQARREIIV